MKQLLITRFAVVSIAILMLLPGILFLWLHLTVPSDGARLEPGQLVWKLDGVVVELVEEQSGTIHQGDRIVAVAGRSMESWAQTLFEPDALRPNWHSGQTITYSVVRDGQRLDIPVTLKHYPIGAILLREWSTIFFSLVFLLVAALVFFLRPDDSAARVQLLIGASITGATTWSLGLQVSDLVNGTGFWIYIATALGIYTLFWASLLHFVLIFPRPHPLIVRHSCTIPLFYIVPYIFHLVYFVSLRFSASSTLEWIGNWFLGETLLPLVYLALTIVAMISNYRTNSTTTDRKKIRWLVLAVLVSGGSSIFIWFLPTVILRQPMISSSALGLLILPYPLALAISILRHHLFDIDILINRTLVYSILSASVIGIYALVVSILGTFLNSYGSFFNSLLATGLVAVLFQPLRSRLQLIINRLMYGERDDPYAVLTRLSQRLEATLAAERVLPTIVETIAQALKLPYAAIAWKRGDEFALAASYGLPQDKPFTLPLIYQTEVIGQLLLAPRDPGDSFSSADQRLLEDIAHQAGIAAYAVRLTADLQKSRERLVCTREEERRRLRRDLHDGLGPTLASMTLKLDAARNLLVHNPSAVDSLLVEMKAQMQATLVDIRRLVYDLRPPALDELGLVSALREQAAHYSQLHGVHVVIETPPLFPTLTAAAEVAAYRIALEALTNVGRHAQAHNCCIRFLLDDTHSILTLEVIDDGLGLSTHSQPGVGIASMRERAAELGGTCIIKAGATGGTHVLVRLPLAKE